MFGRGKFKIGEDLGYGMVVVNCFYLGLSEREINGIKRYENCVVG